MMREGIDKMWTRKAEKGKIKVQKKKRNKIGRTRNNSDKCIGNLNICLK